MHPVVVLPQEFDDREDEVIGLVQRVENLVAGDQDVGRAADPPLDLDEPQLASAWHTAFDVVSPLLKFPVNRFKAQFPLDGHDNLTGLRRGGLGITSLQSRRLRR